MSAGEKHKRRRQPLIEKLNVLAEGVPAKIVLALTESAGEAGISQNRLIIKGGLEPGECRKVVEELSESGKLIATLAGGEAWTLIPFEEVEPRWKVIAVDGQSPLNDNFNSDFYPLSLPFSIIGEFGNR